MSMIYYDNTRISSYRGCPRQFFFRHHRDWLPEGAEKLDLTFGQAWHSAMNVVWNKGSFQDAMLAFTNTWIEEGLLPPTADNYQIITQASDKKNPWVAMEMLQNYIKQRQEFINDCTEIEIERPFAVPLNLEQTIFYIGRLDKIVKHRIQGRLVIEHKTTGWYAKEGGFRSDYIESFSPNSQVDGYIFAGNSLYGDGIKGVWVDAALCHKTVHDKFKFIPCDRQFAMMDDWLNDTIEWVNRIQTDLQRHSDGVHSFPKNTSSCNIFSGCSYRNICKFVANPTASIQPPSGYRIEKWEPFDVLKIGQILERKGD